MDGTEGSDGTPQQPSDSPKFSVMYLGTRAMDKLYSQTMQPWVMAEVRRSRADCQEVTIQIEGETLSVKSVEGNQVDLHHSLKGLTRFAKLHQDPKCFAYLIRENPFADFHCHVYMANTQEVIPELFRAIRDVSKGILNRPCASSDQSPNPGEVIPQHSFELADPGNSIFEVKYIGRAKVGTQRVTSELIDNLADKMLSLEEESNLSQLERTSQDVFDEDAVRQHTGVNGEDGAHSISVVDEQGKDGNDLLDKNKLSSPKTLLDSVTRRRHFSHQDQTKLMHNDSTESLEHQKVQGRSIIGSFAAARSLSFSSGQGLLGRQRRSSGDIPSSSDGQHQRKRHMSHDHDEAEEMTIILSGDGKGGEGGGVTSGVSLLQMGQTDLGLLSLDTKVFIMEAKFSDISFVSQGSRKKNVFGIIARSTASSFTCYILKCLTDCMVSEIMTTLQSAFTAAYQKTGSHETASQGAGNQHMCTSCPLHQLHKLCQEIHSLSSQAAHDILMKKIHNLPEKEINEIRRRVQDEAPESFEESVEVIMICLHQLCERKQRDHVHNMDLTDHTLRHAKPEICFHDEKHTLFEGLRNKARKSFTTSFENLLHRGRKKEEIKDGFRQRSWTSTDSDVYNSLKGASTHSTPEGSPMPSPLLKDAPHQFPSPPASPTPHASQDSSPTHRRRSATLDSQRSSASPTAGMLVGQRRDVNHNKPASPMKTNPVITPSSPQPVRKSVDSLPDLESSYSTIPEHVPYPVPRKTSASWRKAIFQKVVTTQHSHDLEEDEIGESSHQADGSKPLHIRAMWRKAFLETILLIRIEKENYRIRARDEEGGVTPCRKLEYEELTPCLKEITSIWQERLNSVQEDIEAKDSIDGYTDRLPQEMLLDYVKKGVPRSLRGQIWLYLMQQHQISTTFDNTESSDADCVAAGDGGQHSHTRYDDLLKQLTTHQHAILIDLGRTFPTHPYFTKSLGAGQLELFNLLKAYSLLDTEVGYCQGLSFIAGILLMHMEEVSAFHVLKYMMYDLGLREQFKPNMTALQIKLYQLTRLLHDHCRDVYDHFEVHDISPTLYAAPWFLTLFASQFPLGFVARVFDMIFVQGIDVLFKVALMLVVNHRALILQCSSFESVVDFLKITLPEMVQVQMERVISQAFELDITKELQAYKIEYSVIGDELAALESVSPHHRHQHHHSHNKTSPMHPNHPQHPLHHGSVKTPQAPVGVERPTRFINRRRSSIDFELMYKMEHQNRSLKLQNTELVDKLQQAQSAQRMSELEIHSNKLEMDKLMSHVRSLEIERTALLSAVATMKRMIPKDTLPKLDEDIPQLNSEHNTSDDATKVEAPTGADGSQDGRSQQADNTRDSV